VTAAVSYQVSLVNMFGDDLSAHVTGVEPALDMDKTPWGTVTITLAGLTSRDVERFDPRLNTTGNMIQLHVTQVDAATGSLVSMYPGSSIYATALSSPAVLMVQSYDHDELTGVTTVVACTGEIVLMDQIRLAGTTLDTHATTVLEMVKYAVHQTFGPDRVVYDLASAGSAPVSIVERRSIQPGQSYWDFITPAVTDVPARVFVDLPGPVMITIREQAPVDADLTDITASTTDPDAAVAVTGVIRHVDRTGDYADGILARFTYLNATGVQTTGYQASSASVQSRGRVIEFQTAPPTGNIAEKIVARTKHRGTGYDVKGRCNFNARPGRTMTLDGTDLGMIRSVSWRLDFEAGADEMTVTTQIGTPEE